MVINVEQGSANPNVGTLSAVHRVRPSIDAFRRLDPGPIATLDEASLSALQWDDSRQLLGARMSLRLRVLERRTAVRPL
jgi:hypothetical protein